MNLSTLLTTLAFVTAAEAKLGGTPSFPEQVSFLEKHSVGGQPDYCYPSKGGVENNDCYKEGFPKCCSKSKGNCPNNKKPGCECLPGTCGGSGGDTKGDRCTQSDGTCKGSTFCKTTEGTCAGEGRCREMTTSCDRSMKQVCGCNGATYDNECAAFGVGVSVDYDRACGTPPAEADDFCWFDHGPDRCRSNEFCAIGIGDCLSRTGRIGGTCTPYRKTCAASYDPVCGCDDKTYDNEGCALAQGVNVMKEGECDRISPCTYYGVNDDTCSGNSQLCRLDDGDCKKKVASQSGTCGIKPTSCSYDYKPVCGCDSKTHANECIARSHGVNIMHDGEC